MDSTLRSYLTEALYANVTTETFFEEDEEEINGVADTDYKEGVTRLSSINSFKSIAYIDDDVESEESETGCKDEQNHVVFLIMLILQILLQMYLQIQNTLEITTIIVIFLTLITLIVLLN